MSEKYAERGLVVLGVTSETTKKPDTEKFVAKHGARYPYAYDPGGRLQKAFDVLGIPAAALVDPSGRVVWRGHPSGLTDEILEWQTRELLARETHREGQIVHVRPELVVEVAFNDVQRSPHYPGGVALRFARIKGYRHDKGAHEADTIETVVSLAPREA